MNIYILQLRLGSHEPFANGDEEPMVSIGFRTLVNNNAVGANLFHDYEFDEGHQGSLGWNTLPIIFSYMQIFMQIV